MIQTVTFSIFQDEFQKKERTANFTNSSLKSLFDYYEELESDTGEQIALDVIAICCEWSEYDMVELIEKYGDIEDRRHFDDDEEYVIPLLKNLRNKTTVIETSFDTYLVEQF